jgi:hypothetical protein
MKPRSLASGFSDAAFPSRRCSRSRQLGVTSLVMCRCRVSWRRAQDRREHQGNGRRILGCAFSLGACKLRRVNALFCAHASYEASCGRPLLYAAFGTFRWGAVKAARGRDLSEAFLCVHLRTLPLPRMERPSPRVHTLRDCPSWTLQVRHPPAARTWASWTKTAATVAAPRPSFAASVGCAGLEGSAWRYRHTASRVHLPRLSHHYSRNALSVCSHHRANNCSAAQRCGLAET